MNYTQLSRWAAIAWMIAILIGCFLPGPDVPPVFSLYDKFVHLTIFVPFGVLWIVAGSRPGWVVLAGLGFGVFIEIMQAILPIHRTGDVKDALADFVGVLLGVGLAWGARRVIKF